MNRAVPVLPIEDMEAAKAFYVDGLGFNVLYEAPDASDPSKTFLMGLERDGMRINLDSPMTGHGRNACVDLEVGDVDAFYAEWSAKVEIPHPPKNEPWGSRTFGMLDPSGNTIFVLGPTVDE